MLIQEAIRFARDRDEVYAILEQALASLPRSERCFDSGDRPPHSVDEVQSVFSHLFFRLDHASRVLNEPTCRALKDAIQSCGMALQRLHSLEGNHHESLMLPDLPPEGDAAPAWSQPARSTPPVSRPRQATRA